MSIFDEKRALQATCAHENTEPHVARFTGAPSRCCQDCGVYLILWDEDEDE